MPYKSRWTVPIPECSFPTFQFTSASHTEPPELANKPCYLDAANPDTHFFTRASYKLWAQRFALGLTRLPDFQPGDRVQIFSSNNLAFPVAFMGIIMAGGIFTAANPTFVPRELAYQLKDSGAKYMFAAEGSLDTAVQAAKEAGLPADRVRWFDADMFFEKGSADKGSKQGVEYWNGIFAGPEEAKSYQWNELKGMIHTSEYTSISETPRPHQLN